MERVAAHVRQLPDDDDDDEDDERAASQLLSPLVRSRIFHVIIRRAVGLLPLHLGGPLHFMFLFECAGVRLQTFFFFFAARGQVEI